MTFSDFIESAGSRDLRLTVVNRTELDPVYGMLEDAFAGQAVDVEEYVRSTYLSENGA